MNEVNEQNSDKNLTQGSSVEILDKSENRIQEGEILTRGDGYLYFVVEADSSLMEHMKVSNQIKLRPDTTPTVTSGNISCLDHRPSLYERTTIKNHSETNQSKRVIQFQEQAEIRGNSSASVEELLELFRSWNKVFHFGSLPATVVPIMLGIIYALWMEWTLSITASISALLGGIFLHCASNLHNDLTDYHQSLIENKPLSKSPINQTPLNPGRIWIVALSLYTFSLIPGFYLLLLRGSELLVTGLLAFLIASFYTLHRYHTKNYTVYRDFLLFVLTGPLMAVAASISASGYWDWKLCLAGLPTGLFIALILHQNNIHNIPIDRRAGATTLAIVLGFKGSKYYYHSLLLAGYVVIGILSFASVIPIWSLLTFITFPLAVYNFRLLNDIKSPLNPRINHLRYSTFFLALAFGVFYMIGFLTEVFIKIS